MAVVAHLLVILGISFTSEDRIRNDVSTLDIVLVQSRSEKTPEDTQVLAQANQDGGGQTDRPERPSTPLPAPFTSSEALLSAVATPRPPSRAVVSAQSDPLAAAPVKTDPVPPKATPKPVLTQNQKLRKQKALIKPKLAKHNEKVHLAKAKVEDAPERRAERAPPPKVQSKPTPKSPIDAAALINRSLAMASLSAAIDQRVQAYAQRPRRKWITARTREHKFAAYMEAWRAKVERLGNLNYPDEARRRRLSGSLLLDVSLKRDGSIDDIVLRRSSGKKVLDDAAVRIVRLAAPYGKFPASFTKDVDILHIERTWRFTAENRLGTR